jgi:glycogen(starch) synthase
MEVEEIVDIPSEALKQTLDNLSAHGNLVFFLSFSGVKFLFGRWLIEGAPLVLLFDIGASYHRMNEWKADLWNTAGIPSPSNDFETNEAIIFGYLVSWFFGEVFFQNF